MMLSDEDEPTQESADLGVLILVLMDDALWSSMQTQEEFELDVLILVFMDDALW